MTARLAVIVLSLTLTMGCATAKRWSGLAAHDARSLVGAPDARTWKKAAIATGAIIAATALDDEIRDAARANTATHRGDASKVIGPFGGRYSDRVIAAFLLGGLATNNDRAKAVAFDAFVSSLIASKVITPALKQVVGRDRPNEADDASSFDGGSAFPSNHTTQAFAVASVIATHYESRWVDAAASGLAGLVGVSRIYDEAHWLSDTIAGAVIGTATGRFIAATNKRQRRRWVVTPVVDSQRRGVMISLTLP